MDVPIHPREDIAALAGVWRRTSLRIGDGAPFEAQSAWWIQVGDVFADIRFRPEAPHATDSAFSGRVAWTPPDVAFRHDLDDLRPPRADVATLSIEDDRIVEAGIFGEGPGATRFEEVWVRHAPADAGRRICERRGAGGGVIGRCVEAGGHAVVILDERGGGGVFSAALFVRSQGAWAQAGAVGGGAMLRRPQADPAWTTAFADDAPVEPAR